MTDFFSTVFGYFLSWWGAFLIAVLDALVVFFLPFGVDAVMIFLVARDDELFWIYPLLTAAGSVTGAAGTFWTGRKLGEVGVERFVSKERMERLKRKVNTGGALAIAVPAVLPPPFPLTPFVLTCGALDVNRARFLTTFGTVRLLRFGAEAWFARVYGEGILAVLESDVFQTVVVGFIIVAVLGTIVSAVMLWRSTHAGKPAAA